jgi:two-component system response regulator
MNRILLVEDERIVALALKHELAGLGYNVVAMASSGEDALLALTKHEPDVVLMDIMIEGDMDGIETARKIAQISSVPIVYLTGEAEKSTRDRAFHSPNIMGYILKPVNPTALVEVLWQLREAKVAR